MVRKEIIYFFRKAILFPIYFVGVFLEYDIRIKETCGNTLRKAITKDAHSKDGRESQINGHTGH